MEIQYKDFNILNIFTTIHKKYLYLWNRFYLCLGRSQSEENAEDNYEPKPKRGRPTGTQKGPKESKVGFTFMNTKD